ncbi:MAG: penicillin-binding transpeptidase domain-containing protein [Planctomycetota bacterium]|nr:penicillin-binding transpeptidase domain-containing protein [Planctomycetota bacterium]
MIGRRSLVSASGLRPTSAFVVIAVVMVAVAARVATVSWAGSSRLSGSRVDEAGLDPSFELRDVRGYVLARFVERIDVRMSPRSMWRAHTPEYMAARISECLGGEPSPRKLVDTMLPDAEDGVIRVEGLDLAPRTAIEVGAWIVAEDLNGIWLERIPGPRYAIAWEPQVLLSRAEREAHDCWTPARWTRRILNGLAVHLFGEPEDGQPVPREWREEIWKHLLPCGYCLPIRGVPPERALALRDLLREEGVASVQMRLVRGRDREYPQGSWEVLGSWGYVRGDEAEPFPRAGLELFCHDLFQRGDWPLSPPQPAVYSFRVNRNRPLGSTSYYLSVTEAEAPPSVDTTLDVDLQRAVRRELEGVMAEHDPAVAMAIVLDLESGNVLAVDSLEKVPIGPFAPVSYAFTPGSTFKLVTMATALDIGVVHPEEELFVGYPPFPLEGSSRVIHEAEGSLEGTITATESLAFSVNAGLVQIGQRIPDAIFHERVLALGYGARPEAGLGFESAGVVTDLPWSFNWSHVSISFGHEMTTTLWQHAAGLAAIVRGGVWKPLTLVRSVEQGGEVVRLEPDEGRRVFRADTCAIIRRMMELGAREGTGRTIARENIVMATKTGTAQKVPSELCVHVEAQARAECAAAGVPMTPELFRSLKSRPRPHSSCYTSSMCVVGRLREGGDEVMVLVVVDEPCGKQKYGSRVAGPAAAAILVAALGPTRRRDDAEDFRASDLDLVNPFDEPWSEEPQGEGR